MTFSKAGWTAIVLAGQRPGVDPLAEAFGIAFKALVPVAGVPMLRRVCDTLLACPEIARIVVLGQDIAALAPAIPDDERVTIQTSTTGISASILAVAGSPSAPWPLLLTTADHPLLTCEMVRDCIASAGDADLAVGMVERRTLEAAYPGNRRTWRQFSDGAYSGANLFALTGERVREALMLWQRAERDRKKQLALLWHFGPWLALRAITRTISLESGLAAAGRRLGLSAKPVILSQAEAAIDVDKLSDHALVERIMAARR